MKWAVWLFYSHLTSCNISSLPLDLNHEGFRHGVGSSGVVWISYNICCSPSWMLPVNQCRVPAFKTFSQLSQSSFLTTEAGRRAHTYFADSSFIEHTSTHIFIRWLLSIQYLFCTSTFQSMGHKQLNKLLI